MTKRKKWQVMLDITMTILLPLLMAYSLFGEALHEWAGLALFHQAFHFSWLKNIGRGKYNGLRLVTSIVNGLIIIGMFLMVTSGILMSKHIFTFLPQTVLIPLARLIHLAASYWFYCLTSLHLGMNWQKLMIVPKKIFHLKKNTARKWLLRVAAIMIALLGCYEFIQRDFWGYMSLANQFAFYDFSEPLWHFMGAYLAVLGFWVVIGHYGLLLVQKYLRLKKSTYLTK